MSYAPQKLLDLRNYLQDRTGLSVNALGIVGDSSHTYGYHLGEDRLPDGDYSAQTARDRAGLSDAASASDIGNFNDLVALTAYLVAEARAGRAPDLRAVIGPHTDGRAYRWDFEDGSVDKRADEDSHEWHAHLSWYRDSEHREKISLFRPFFDDSSRPSVPATPSKPSTDWTERVIMALPTLKQGSRGSDVGRLQGLLAANGYPPHNSFNAKNEPDDQFGDGTGDALEAFQEARNVKNSVRNGKGDRIAGRYSWTALLGE